MTQPTERDLSYRDAQRAAAVSVRGKWAHRNGRTTPESMPRHTRLALRAISRSHARPSSKLKAAERLLGLDPVSTVEFLKGVDFDALAAKPKPRVIAFNHTPLEGKAEDGTITINRPFHNAAKRQRRARREVRP